MGYTRPTDSEESRNRVRAIRRMLWIIFVLNVAVALAKLSWGIVTGSSAMQADGFHSMFDGASNVIGLIGMGFASRPADRDHPYGHGKYETYASAIIGAMLLFAAYRIGSEAIAGIVGNAPPPAVSVMSFVVMIGTLAVNLVVTGWEHAEGKRLGSAILVADASHTASDALVSIGVIVGLILVRLGVPKADPVVALLVTGAIIFTAWEVFKQASATLSDSARIAVEDVCTVALGVPGVLGCHHIRTRGAEAEVLVDLHIQVAPDVTVSTGHEIAEQVERALAEQFPQVADVLAHLEPYDAYQQAKTENESRAGL